MIILVGLHFFWRGLVTKKEKIELVAIDDKCNTGPSANILVSVNKYKPQGMENVLIIQKNQVILVKL